MLEAAAEVEAAAEEAAEEEPPSSQVLPALMAAQKAELAGSTSSVGGH